MGRVELDKIRKKLADNVPVFGTVTTTREPMITEMMGAVGFDFVWIDNEHSVIERSDILSHVIAAKAAGIASFVRVVWNKHYFIKPILEMGPDGLIIPCAASAEEVDAGLAACFYPPKGIRGFGPQRAARYDTLPMPEYLQQYPDDMFRIFQIEHVGMVEQLDEICQKKDIDLFIVGPNDLSGSLGILQQYDNPLYLETVHKIADITTKHGIPFGVAGSTDVNFVKFWRSLGARVFCCGLDMGILSVGMQNALGAIKNEIK